MSEPSDFKKDLEHLTELIKDIQFAMLTTTDDDGSLRSRPMALQQDDFDGTLYFFTYGTSHKVFEVRQNHQVNVSFSRPDRQSYVSLSGEASLSRDKVKMENLWNPALMAWFPKGLDEPDIALLQIEVSKAEYWDAPNNVIAHAVGFVKTAVLGQKPQSGEDKQLDFEAGVSKSAS